MRAQTLPLAVFPRIGSGAVALLEAMDRQSAPEAQRAGSAMQSVTAARRALGDRGRKLRLEPDLARFAHVPAGRVAGSLGILAREDDA